MAAFGDGIGIGSGSINVDGEGIDGGGGGNSLHLTYSAQLFCEPLRRGEVQTWEGDEVDILKKFRGIKVGTATEEFKFITAANDAWGTPFIAGVQAPRRQGKTWTMAIRVAQCRKAVMWHVDFAEVQKDIRTWMQDYPHGSGEWQNGEAPDLSKLAKWERAKDIQDWDDYDAFKTTDGEELTGNTLELAKMIRKGIESYTIHTPVPTMTMQYFDGVTGTGKLLDKYLTELPSGPSGWEELGGAKMWEQMQDLTYIQGDFGGYGTKTCLWLCVGDKANSNGDGSSTRNVQFMRVDQIDQNLYQAGDEAEGGFGE